jgi:hypothetical protein
MIFRITSKPVGARLALALVGKFIMQQRVIGVQTIISFHHLTRRTHNEYQTL